MNSEEVKNHFAGNRVYLFDGSRDELNDLMVANGISYGTLFANHQLYFVVHDHSLSIPTDERITEV